MAEYKGIDVSEHNGEIDWKKVKAAGVQFAIIRAGYDRYDKQKDVRFEENYAGAKAAGLHVGAYHYSYAKTAEQAKAEAQTMLAWLKGKSFDYPIVYDIEDASQASLGKSVISDMIRAFCSTIEAAGYYAMVYANKNWLETRIDDDCKARYDVWLAQWTSKPTYAGNYGIWQYTSDGAVDGISGRVDMNIAYKDYPALIAGTSTPVPEKNIDVEYQAYTTAWLPWVENAHDNGTDGYAGITGKAATALRAAPSEGHLRYRAHTVGGKWYDWVTDYDLKTKDGYAGVLGKPMDMLQMELVGVPGYQVEYRVSTIGGGYLPWVRNYNTVNSDGYAGITGKPIDRVQVRIVKVA